MTGLIRNAAITAACMLVAAVAYAGVPSPSTSVVGGGNATERINLVGYANGASDPANSADSVEYKAKLQVLVKDLAGNAVPGSNVVIDFSGCTGDIKIASAQKYHAEVVGCSGVTVSDYTNATGYVNFVVVGGRSGNTAHTYGCAKVYADGVLLKTIGVGTFDQNNAQGVTLADVGFFWADYFSGSNPDRADIDMSGGVALADVGYSWASYFTASRENTSGASLCP